MEDGQWREKTHGARQKVGGFAERREVNRVNENLEELKENSNRGGKGIKKCRSKGRGLRESEVDQHKVETTRLKRGNEWWVGTD